MKTSGSTVGFFASVQAARIVNWLLESAGSAERGYMLYAGGDEGIIQFMKPNSDEYTAAFADPRISDRSDDFGTLGAPGGDDGNQ